MPSLRLRPAATKRGRMPVKTALMEGSPRTSASQRGPRSPKVQGWSKPDGPNQLTMASITGSPPCRPCQTKCWAATRPIGDSTGAAATPVRAARGKAVGHDVPLSLHVDRNQE